MGAYRFDACTGRDDLRPRDVADPVPQRGEALVRIRAVALNDRDVSAVSGDDVWRVKLGFVPCGDAAGDVVAVGRG